jgi:hypothetical protein
MNVPPDWPRRLREFVDRRKQNPTAEEYIGDNPFDKFVLTHEAESWEEFLEWLNDLQGSWCFRGQRESMWLLYTSLDRAVKREELTANSRSLHHLNREIEQRELLFRFQQQAHVYVRHPPALGDLASWLALMQHHGAPTRFLDWTRSPFVAAYFAFEEEAREESKRSAIWAVDLDWIETRGYEQLLPEGPPSSPDDSKSRARRINSLLAQNEKAVIVRIDPIKSNERMAVQQGIFLCKLLHEASFSQTLMRMMIHPQTPNRPVVRRLEVESSRRKEFLKNLRAMNIHRASLFPGLDGFAQSLRLDLEIK